MGIHRFRFAGGETQGSVEEQITGSATLSPFGPVSELDVALADDANLPDLVGYLLEVGWTFVGSSPTAPLPSITTEWQGSVISDTISAPPGGPADGDRYIVPVGATGAWAGHVTEIAQWSANASAWLFIVPTAGTFSWVDSKSELQFFQGGAWGPFGGGSVPAFAAPVTIGTANAAGAAATIVRSDHVHAHGSQPGGALHALVTPDPGGVAGFMSPADKEKLDGLSPGGGAVGDTSYLGSTVSTTLGTFQNAFAGSELTVPQDGTYMIQFEGNIGGSSGSTVNETAIAVGGVTVADSIRQMQGNGGASISSYTHTFSAMTAGAVVTGEFRKSSGPGTTTMTDRRVTMIKVA